MDLSWLTSIAPTIATALGGPLAGLAVEAISKSMGIDPEEVQKTLNSGKLTADQVASLQKADADLKARAQELGLDFEKLAVADRSSARDMQISTKSYVPPVLAALVVFAWITIQWFLLTKVVDPTMMQVISRMLGTLDGALMLVLAFYFGSSNGSQQKDELLHRSTPS